MSAAIARQTGQSDNPLSLTSQRVGVIVRQVGASQRDGMNVTRRGFLGWSAALATLAVVPGAALVLTESPATAAAPAPASVSPYRMASWEGLVQRSVVVTSAAGSSQALTVTAVTHPAGGGRVK